MSPQPTTCESMIAIHRKQPADVEDTQNGDGVPQRAVTTGIRVALYSHDTMGLGHFRRNLLIAQTLASSPLRPTCLMIAGAWKTRAFAMPICVDCLTLLSLCKNAYEDF